MKVAMDTNKDDLQIFFFTPLESWNPRTLTAQKIELKSSPKGEGFSPIPRRKQLKP